MKIKSLVSGIVLLSGLLAMPASAITYSYVGSWDVGDGDLWTTNPGVFSGQEAAAFIFGGVASDYAISTVSDLVADINFKAWLDGWGDSATYGPDGGVGAAQDFKLDSGAPGYNDPYGGPSYSAYVADHFYDYNKEVGTGEAINYAFRIDRHGVPDSGSTALLAAIGFVALAAARRRFIS